jgi:EF hand
MKQLLPILAAGALLFAGAAFSQEKPAAPAPDDSASGGATAPRPSAPARDAASSRAPFDRLDKNKDGYLTGSELTSPEALSANWLSVDRDGDGRISRSEFTAIGAPATGTAAAGASRR